MKIKSKTIYVSLQTFRFALGISVFSLFSLASILAQAPVFNNSEKINGVSFLSPKKAMLDLDMVASVKESNAEWVAFTILKRF